MARKFVFLLIFTLIFVYLWQNNPTLSTNTQSPKNMENVNFKNIPKSAVKENWSQIWNKGDFENGHAVAVDKITGDVYVTGNNRSASPPYNRDVVLIKYNNSGDQEWNITWDNGAQEIGYDVAVDSEGYVYVCGGNGTAVPETQNTDMLLLKFNSSGQLEWVRTWNVSTTDVFWGIDIDTEDNIYTVGDSFGDIWLFKYNKTGHKQWDKQYDEDVVVSGRRVVCDDSSNCYVVGYNNTNTNSDILLIKFDDLGNHLWNTTWKGEELDEGTAIALDSSNNIYVSGITNNTYASTGYDLVLLKFDNNGTLLWNRTWGSIYDEYRFSVAVAVDSTDSVYIAGSVIFNSLDVALLKYSSSGNLLWNISWTAFSPPTSPDYVKDIFIDPQDNIYITGFFNYLGDDSIFLIKYLPDPGSFTVYSNAGYPDTDGVWTLSWTSSIRADNYSLYASGINHPIAQIDETLQVLFYQTLLSPTDIHFSTGYNGNYYFIMVAHNEYGNMTSNVLHIWVSISSGDDDDDDDDDEEPPISGYDIWYLLGILVAISIVLYKKRLENSKL